MKSLPIFKSDSREMTQMQTSWANALNPVLKFPVNSGLILQGVSLVTGSNTINHRLGRKLQGWQIVRKRADAAVYDTQDDNDSPELTLLLETDADVTVDLLVF